MKKLLAILLLLAMTMTCAIAETADEDLIAAKTLLFFMYKNSPETTMTDYEVVGVMNIGGIEFPITWTADHESVKIIPNAETKMVTIDVDEQNPEEVFYTLTATLSNAAGETESVSFQHKVPAALILEGMSYEEIVAAAYTLEDGLSMTEPQRLYGVITKIDTAYSEQYGNITVTIQIGDLADQTIQCYRLSGEGCAQLQVGDAITVEGTIKNYKGTIEFDKPTLIGMGEVISQQAILDAAYALEDGTSMTAQTALCGEIVKIVSAYSPEYGNITVDMVCDGKTEQVIQAYRLSGEGVEALAVGDKIAVYGTIKNYKGTIEFDKGCKLIPYESAADVRTLLAAYTLEDGLSMNGESTLTGVIHNIATAYSPDYKNITVDMTVAGIADMPIQCYRLSGEGAEGLAVGDTVTVTGTIKNYKGTIEFDKGCTIDAIVKAAAEETPAVEETPVEETPVEETPVVEETVEEAAAEPFCGEWKLHYYADRYTLTVNADGTFTLTKGENVYEGTWYVMDGFVKLNIDGVVYNCTYTGWSMNFAFENRGLVLTR